MNARSIGTDFPARACLTGLALAVATACGGDSSGPSSGVGPTVPTGTHPAGTIYKVDTIGSEPYGVAIASTGVIYVTQAAHFRIARLDSTGTETDSILVAGGPVEVAFSPDGAAAYDVDNGPRTLNFISVPTNTVVATLHYPSPTRPYRVLRRGSLVFVTSSDSNLRILDASNAAVEHSILVGDGPNGLAFSPDGNTLYVSNAGSGTVSVVSLGTNRVVGTIPVQGNPEDLAASITGGKLFVANARAGVSVWNTSTRQLITTIGLPGNGETFGLAMSPDGKQVWAASPTQGRVYIIDVGTDAIVGTVETGGTPRRLAFSKDGTFCVITNEAGWVDFVN